VAVESSREIVGKSIDVPFRIHAYDVSARPLAFPLFILSPSQTLTPTPGSYVWVSPCHGQMCRIQSLHDHDHEHDYGHSRR